MKVRFAIAPGRGSQSRAALAAFADALERSGFDGIWLSDLPLSATLDPLLALALIAGRTERLRLGANVVPLGRNPFRLAKELAQLDQLSEGRVLLNFVPGVEHEDERELLQLAGNGRGALLEEAVGDVRSWWSAGAPAQQAATRRSAELTAATRPCQSPLEIWLGGHGPKALERAGKIADGWLGSALAPDEAAGARQRIIAAANRAGREIDPEHYGLSIAYARTAPEPEVLAMLGARRPGVDPLALLPVGAQGLRALLGGYVEGGLSKFVLRPAAAVASWTDEVSWLSDAILDLQT